MMIRSTKSLHGFAIHATDGDLGKVADIYFDEEAWTIRYLIVDTGNWLTGRSVLISPISVESTDWEGRHINVDLTRDQVKNAPGVDTAVPVSRQQEMEFYEYYGWPVYWSGENLWGPWTVPGMAATAPITPPPAPSSAKPALEPESHLRSVQEVLGDSIHASDGDIGRVDDFLVQDFNWSIQYIVVNTSSWFGGDKVLLSPVEIKQVNWAERSVVVKMDCEAVKHSTRYNPNELPDQDSWVNDASQRGAR